MRAKSKSKLLKIGRGAEVCACAGVAPIWTIGLSHRSGNAAAAAAVPPAAASTFSRPRLLTPPCDSILVSL
jgi:hypothetical protein